MILGLRITPTRRLGDAFIDAGLPYNVEGNPVIALIAQVNRFINYTVKGPGCPNGSQPTLGFSKFPVQPALTPDAAYCAIMIMRARHLCSDPNLRWTGSTADIGGKGSLQWLDAGSKAQGDWTFVMNNLDWFTKSIAQFADYLGRDVAAVGIKVADTRVFGKGSSTNAKAVVLGVVLVLGGILALWSNR
jgi:hypothetical protein